MTKPEIIIDEDTTDEFLDAPELRYSDGRGPMTGERLDELLDPTYRRKHGITLPTLPPPTDH